MKPLPFVLALLSLTLTPMAWGKCTIQALQSDVAISHDGKRPTQAMFQYRLWCDQPTRGFLSVNNDHNGTVWLAGKNGNVMGRVYVNDHLASQAMEVELSNQPQVVEVLFVVETGQRLLPVDDYQFDFALSFKPE